jgi:predicted phage baseplate assembly protein
MNAPTSTCGCCEGVEKLTPLPLANRPGLSALAYRAGTHSTFLETMLARLSGTDLPALAGLTTRDPGDPSIALLDAWATVGDVLTFYQERLANEGYLRTATERRSVLELARLVGYTLRPGVGSTVYLAYTLDEDRSTNPPKGMEVTIPAGSRAQSVPGPGELPQPFESAADLPARTAWNKLQPRMSRPQTAESIAADGLYLKGTATNLKPNDPLLIGFGFGKPIPLRVVDVKADPTLNRTHLTLRLWFTKPPTTATVAEIAQRHLKHPASPGTEMARRVQGLLTNLAERTKTDSPKALVEFMEKETLPKLAEEHKMAKESQFTNLEPWLAEINAELEKAHSDLEAGGPTAAGDGGREIEGFGFRAGAKAAEFSFGLKAAAPKAELDSKDFFASLKKPPSLPPPNAASLPRKLETAFPPGGDIFPRLLTTFRPLLGKSLVSAIANATVAEAAEIKVYALRVSASLFGHNTPNQPVFGTEGNEKGKVVDFTEPNLSNTWGELARPTEDFPTIALDAEYDQIKPRSLMIIDRPALDRSDAAAAKRSLTIHKVQSTETTTMAAHGASPKVTLASISRGWFAETNAKEVGTAKDSTALLRGTRVYAQSELLELAEAPITDPICGADIELDGLYDGLDAGRWLIISGERADVFDVNGERIQGIQAAELAMLLSVKHQTQQVPDDRAGEDKPLPGDKTHTFIKLSTKPAYCYVRDKVTIHGNVVKATHGETRNEVLGGGDASKPMQAFMLRQSPLTYLPAPTPAGAASTLVIRVNEVEWHETDTLAGLAPDDRKFITKTDDESKTKVIFGNGREGARPPTGAGNIAAVYRNGIGEPGNAKARQVSMLVSRPLGVKEVINPIGASGGADRESRDQARKNAPIGVLALDRLVSVRDYADFTRTFAGIGKASAAKLSDGLREVVHVTIAGANDIPIDEHSDLYRNLVRALRDLGDPHLPIEVELREMLSLVVCAKVRVLPDYAWEFVEPKIRAALLDAFSFERRELAQDVTRSEVIWAIQRVAGVAYVDLDHLYPISEKTAEAELFRTTIDAGKGGAQREGRTFEERLAPARAGQEAKADVETVTLRRFFKLPVKARPCAGHRIVVEPARIDAKAEKLANRILPAQIAVLSPALSETLVITEIIS